MSMYDDGYDEEAADLAASLGQDVVGRGGNQNFTSGGGNTFTDSGGNTVNFQPSTTAGLNQQQFENRFGITDRNPYGQTGFAKFFDRISKAIGGKGVDYSQQFRDIDRMHNLDPGTTQQRMMNRQYQLYREPKIADDGRITSGGIDRLGRGTFQGPVEAINREMGTGEQLVRGGIGALPVVGPMLSGAGGTDLYLSSRVTPEMRARENPSLAEQLRSSLGLGDTIESIANKGSSLIERMQGIVTGQGQQSAQDVIPSGPAMGSMDPSREIGPLAQAIPTLTAAPIAVEEANPQLPMLPAEFDPRLSETTTADMLRDPSFAVQSDPAMSFTEPAPEPKVFDSTLIDQVIAQNQAERDQAAAERLAERDLLANQLANNISQIRQQLQSQNVIESGMDQVSRNAPNFGFERPRNAENIGMPLAPNFRNAPNEGLSRQDFLELFAPEPELGPYEQSQAPTRDLRDSTALAGLDYPTISELMTLGADLMTGGGPRTSIPLGEGTLNFNLNRDNPGVEYRRQLQGKDLGFGELLSFLNSRRT